MRCNVKTCYLYSMTSRLVNVRLDADRLRKVGRLRERGVAMSDLVRQAIDERFEALTSSANNHELPCSRVSGGKHARIAPKDAQVPRTCNDGTITSCPSTTA